MLQDAIKPYRSVRGELTTVQGVLLKSSRLVIPSSMRPEIPFLGFFFGFLKHFIG